MTAENFSYYLKNPGHLYQVSYQELKSLVVQYPYCQNLRYLLMTKSQIENSDEYQNDLQLAATYCVNRSYLYDLVHQENLVESSENYVLNEDYLELKDLSEAEKEEIIIPQASIVSDFMEDELPLAQIPMDNLDAQPTTYLTDSSIPQEAINDDSEEEEIHGEMELTESSDSETPTSSMQEDSVNEELAENISDESDMLSYMEKPKKSKSVIDQLLKKSTVQEEEQDQEEQSDESNLENEIKSEVDVDISFLENDFMDLSPIKGSSRVGKDVLFEITNKTDKEMDALMQKANQSHEEEDSIDEDLGSMDPTEDTDLEHPEQPIESSPSPKTSFKSYVDQFQPPPGFIEDLEKEDELANAIDEAIGEEEADGLSKKRKKSKKKKKKKKAMAKLKKMKKVKAEKKAKKKKKAKVIAEANKSVQQSDDIVSETLAELLGKQGSRKKAIQMYKRLSLIFPKKSSFFAKKIAKLKK